MPPSLPRSKLFQPRIYRSPQQSPSRCDHSSATASECLLSLFTRSIIVQRSSQLKQQRREFSSDASRMAHHKVRNMPWSNIKKTRRQASKIDSGRSRQSALSQEMQTRMPNDLGLLQGTLVMPTGENLPSSFSNFRTRLRMEWDRLKKRVTDYISLQSGWVRSQQPRLKLGSRAALLATADRLHKSMHEHIASGDASTVSNIALENLADNIKANASTRPPTATYMWRRDAVLGAPRVVSHRAAPLPLKDPGGGANVLRQAVVRLRSVQTLRVEDPTTEWKELEDTREVEELIVLQKRVWKGQEGPWRVWGTTAETSREDWDKVVNPDPKERNKMMKRLERAGVIE